MTVEIFRNALPQATIEVDENTAFTAQLMGEQKIVADTIADSPLPIQIGDYIEHRGERFYINTPPVVEKLNNFTFHYVIVFEGEIYSLYNKIMMHEGQADFSFHGTPEDLLILLIGNMNSIDSGWALATVEEAVAQTLTFTDESCRSALGRIAEAFQMEYRLAGKNIFMQKNVGTSTTLQFEYGRGRGLYSLSRGTIDDKNLVTRAYGFGARKNLKEDYREGATRLVFEERFLEKNTDLFGVREGSVSFEEVFPQRTGVVQGINPDNRNQFIDTTINFNLNDFLIEGTVAKVVFKSGALAGYEFEIKRFVNDQKRVDFTPVTETNGEKLPSSLNFPEIGDTYTFVDIAMPQVYVDEAEALLKDRTMAFLEENSVPRVTYDLIIDEKYARDRGIELRPGDSVRVIDADLGLNDIIRVTDLSYPIVNPGQLTVTISDSVPFTVQERLIADTVENNLLTKDVERKRQELARRSAARFRDLQELIFDPDGFFDPENIRPLSIETLMLSVGAKSQNFGLIGVTIEPNAGGDPNAMNVSNGQLAHYEIEIEGLGYVWNMDPRSFENLDPALPYFMFARCSRTSLTGTWQLSVDPVRVDDIAGFYAFNLGILYAVKDGRRDFDFTNGMTFISGDTITTGTLKSLDGLNFFNLAEGKFKIGNDSSSLDYNVTTEGRLTLKGVFVSSMILSENAVIGNLTVRSLRTRDEGRRLEILEETNNMAIYDSNGQRVALADDDVDSGRADEPMGGFRADNPATGRSATMTSNGVESDGSDIKFFREVSGLDYKASVAGLNRSSAGMLRAGIAGVNLSGNAEQLGGYFFGGALIEGGKQGLNVQAALHLRADRVVNSVTFGERTTYVNCKNTIGTIDVILPSQPKQGRLCWVRRGSKGVIVKTVDGKKIDFRGNLLSSIALGEFAGDTGMFMYDGVDWLYSAFEIGT